MSDPRFDAYTAANAAGGGSGRHHEQLAVKDARIAELKAEHDKLREVLGEVQIAMEQFAEGHCPRAVEAQVPLYERVAKVLQATGDMDALGHARKSKRGLSKP